MIRVTNESYFKSQTQDSFKGNYGAQILKSSDMEYVDSNDYSHGKVGIYLNQDGITFRNAKISKMK